MENKQKQSVNQPIRRWSDFTKRSVTLIILLLLALVVYRFRDLLPPLMVAFLMAFILNPIVDFISDRLPISRGVATTLVFLVLMIAMLATLAAPVTIVPSIQRAVRAVQIDFNRVITDIGAFLERPVEIWGYSLDLSNIYEEISSMLRTFAKSVAQGTLDAAFSLASGAFWLLVIFMSAFYLVKDADRLIKQLNNLAPPGYEEDFLYLRRQIVDVWNAFLRGQLLLGLVMFIITTAVCTAIGLPYAVVMGVIAGLMEFVPNVGPVIALVPAALVALFQGSSFLPLSNFWFAVLVVGLYLIIQQVEGNLLVPRILGGSLNLHPLVVLIGIIIGGNMAGILGMLLAAPVLATLRVIGYYTFCQLYDRDPFAKPPQKKPQPVEPNLVHRACVAAWYRIQEEIKQRKEQDEEEIETKIRPARETDKAAVEAICAQIWDGDDYIPNVWEKWLNDTYGELVVAESAERQIVGIGKLTRLDEDEWWMEGLRVVPNRWGHGIGRQLHTHLAEKARRIGHGSLRFGTHAQNEPVHRLAQRTGFEQVAIYRSYRATPLPTDEAPPLRSLTEEDLPQAWTLVKESPRYRASTGLYEDFWSWKNLTQERMAQHIAEGEAWGLDVQNELAALALVNIPRDEAEGEEAKLVIDYIDGVEGALATLLQGLRELAARRGATEVRFRPVDEAELLAAVEAAGYEHREGHDLWIYELSLDEEEPAS